MKLNRIIPFVILFILAVPLSAQNFQVPKDVVYKTADDYKKYEKDIIEAAKWLVKTPLNEHQEKRQRVSLFVLNWVNGSPTVSVELFPAIMDFEKKNPGMLIIFMANWSSYVLSNNYSTDQNEAKKAALMACIEVYKSGKGIKKDKKMLKLIKAVDAGKIDDWIEKYYTTK